MKKKDITEIINNDGELIGSDDIPQNGSNLSTQANNTSDYNAQIGHQPFRYDMLGRFGFTLLPFFEGVEKGPNDLLDDLARYMYDTYMSTLEHYYRNPEKLKSDFRKKSELDFETDESNEIDYQQAEEVLNIVKPHFEKSLKTLDENLKEGIDEGSFIEGKLLDKEEKKEFSEKTKGKDVMNKQISKIAGLINKLDNPEKNKLLNLLETGNE